MVSKLMEVTQREAELAKMERQRLMNEESLAQLATKNATLAKVRFHIIIIGDARI